MRYQDNLPRAIQRLDNHLRTYRESAQKLLEAYQRHTEAAFDQGFANAVEVCLRILWEEMPSHGTYVRAVLEPGKKRSKKVRKEQPRLRLAA